MPFWKGKNYFFQWQTSGPQRSSILTEVGPESRASPQTRKTLPQLETCFHHSVGNCHLKNAGIFPVGHPCSHGLLTGKSPGMQCFYLRFIFVGQCTHARPRKTGNDADARAEAVGCFPLMQVMCTFQTCLFSAKKTHWLNLFVLENRPKRHSLLSYVSHARSVNSTASSHKTANLPVAFCNAGVKIMAGRQKYWDFSRDFLQPKKFQLFRSVTIFTYGGSFKCLWITCFLAKWKQGSFQLV